MLTWADNAIEKQWLEVSMLATENTGLEEADVFYFGNAIGETGNSATNARVDATDMLGVRDHPRHFLNPAPIDFDFDFNRDQRVDAHDMLIARENPTHFLNALKLIEAPAAAAPSAHDAAMADWLAELELDSSENSSTDADPAGEAVEKLLSTE
jgi:hypothetical protein